MQSNIEQEGPLMKKKCLEADLCTCEFNDPDFVIKMKDIGEPMCKRLQAMMSCSVHFDPSIKSVGFVHSEIASILLRPLLYDVYDRVFIGTKPMHWAGWLGRIAQSHQRYIDSGSKALDGWCFMWFMFFDACARNLLSSYMGNIEIQLLVHHAIYSDLRSGGRAEFIAGIKYLREQEAADENYVKICDAAIHHIETYHSPLISNVLLWRSGNRFGLDANSFV